MHPINKEIIKRYKNEIELLNGRIEELHHDIDFTNIKDYQNKLQIELKLLELQKNACDKLKQVYIGILSEELYKELGKNNVDISENEKGNTYNITINTHGCDNESPKEFAEKFINAIKEMGGNI
jgi:hypothetical protein